MKAYTEKIGQNSSDSHQTSPGYVLTFVRFSNRDSKNYELDSQLTRKPFVVVNDAVAITTQYSKSNPIPTVNCILRQGDINYLTAISPGDFVFVNMLDSESKAMEIRDRAINSQPINRKHDGFKGLFKILDVNMSISTNSAGMKDYNVQFTGRGFDEFNNVLYFNPALPALEGKDNLFLNAFNNFYELIKQKGKNNVQNLVKEIITRSVGQGLNEILKTGIPLDQIPSYLIPKKVGELLGLDAKYVADINKYYIGIWPESASGFSSFFKSDTDEPLPYNKTNFFNTGLPLEGSRQVLFDNFHNVQVWSLLKNYSNQDLNESYTCYREAPNGSVYPTVVIRQKPFNSNHFDSFCGKEGVSPVPNNTKFLSLPRWTLSPDIIKSMSLGRSDRGRINFVIVFTKSSGISPDFKEASDLILKNYVEDLKDIERHGRKPYTVNCYFDYPADTKVSKAKDWAVLIADWVMNGHLKMNGNIQTAGIEEAICVGDNIELDNVVYHIEQITHSMSVSPEGFKSFDTSMALSYGVDLKSNESIPVYAEMDHTDSYTRRVDDFKNEKILPGFSDTQDIPARKDGEEIAETKQSTFTNPRPGSPDD